MILIKIKPASTVPSTVPWENRRSCGKTNGPCGETVGTKPTSLVSQHVFGRSRVDSHGTVDP